MHMNSASVAESACKLIWVLGASYANGDNEQKVGLTGGCGFVVETLNMHMDNASLRESCVRPY